MKIEDNSLKSITSTDSTICSLKCWSFNARSIVNKRLDLLAKLTALSPDVIMVTETPITNYLITFLYRLDRNHHGDDILIAVH